MAKRNHPHLGVMVFGHRDYVGALWDEIGSLQFRFMVDQGLLPRHVLVDIACGSLRGGVHFIPYLDAGNYLGIEKERNLIRLGLKKELSGTLVAAKCPELVVSDTFEFHRFSRQANYAIAQSLFTHLPPAMIKDCLTKLRAFAPECRLFATFSESDSTTTNPETPCDTVGFHYTKSEMEELAVATGWAFRYIGDWGHPRGQVMTEFHPKPASERTGHIAG
jgi:hypothetical protein